MGPGSKVVALTPQLQRHITLVDDGTPRKPRRSFYISFSTILAKKARNGFTSNIPASSLTARGHLYLNQT